MLKFRGLLESKIPNAVQITFFLIPQLLLAIGFHFQLDEMGFEPDVYTRQMKLNWFKASILVIEYFLLLEFFRNPLKYSRY